MERPWNRKKFYLSFPQRFHFGTNGKIYPNLILFLIDDGQQKPYTVRKLIISENLAATSMQQGCFCRDFAEISAIFLQPMHDRAVTANAVTDRKAWNEPSDVGKDYRKWI